MEVIYGLYVISTGEKILEEAAVAALGVWQRRIEKKVLRRRNRAQRFRDAIIANDTIASWENFDVIVSSDISSEELQALSTHIFRGYDQWFNERMGCTWNARKD
jgi:hypothetical protein